MTDILFHIACSNLVHTLIEKGYEIPQSLLKPAPLNKSDYRVNEFERTGFYAEALQHNLDEGTGWVYGLHDPEDIPNWYLVDLTWNTKPEYLDEERYYTAVCKVDALALIISELDKESLIPSSISINGDHILFYYDGELLAEMGPLVTAKVDEKIEQRLVKQLERSLWVDSTESLRRKLKNIPALGRLEEKMKRTSFHPLLVSAKGLANQMERFLADVTGCTLSRSELLEVTAQFFGFESWNHFVGAEKRYGDRLKRPYMVFPYKGSSMGDIDFCIGEAAAFSLFSKKLQQYPEKTFRASLLARGIHLNTATHDKDEKIEQLYVCPVNKVYPSELPLERAELLLESQNLELSLLTYFGAQLPSFEEQLTERVRRCSGSKRYLLINDWLIYIEPSNTGYDEYVMERYDMEHHKRIEHISGAQRKCSFVFDQSTNSVWLSNDWDGKPTFKIDGLSLEQLKEIEKAFFSRNHQWIHQMEKETDDLV